MRKIYRKLTKEQKEAGVIFSSCLSPVKYETGIVHEVKADDPDRVLSDIIEEKDKV